MAYVRTSLRKEKRGLREQMRSMGLGYRDIAGEFARRYGLRPRAAWREAFGWSLQDTADRINEFRGQVGLDPGGAGLDDGAAPVGARELARPRPDRPAAAPPPTSSHSSPPCTAAPSPTSSTWPTASISPQPTCSSSTNTATAGPARAGNPLHGHFPARKLPPASAPRRPVTIPMPSQGFPDPGGIRHHPAPGRYCLAGTARRRLPLVAGACWE